MSFDFLELDDDIRAKMEDEINLDIRKGNLYLSKRFTEQGDRDYPDLLIEAVRNHDEVWLTRQLDRDGRIAEYEMTVTGRKKVPYTAAQTMAEGEFNRFYARAVCLAAIDENRQVEVYRAQEVANARSASVQAIGKKLNPEDVLADLRTNIGIDTHLGLPPGPNSGLSIKRA